MILSLSSLVLFLSCSKDQGTEPLKSSIQGTVTFTGAWPEQPAEVRLVTATEFPPRDINALQIGESIPVDAETFDYVCYLEPDDYKMVGVLWRTASNDWDFSSICGVYFSGVDSLQPGEVSLVSEDATVTDINITVNRSAARLVSDAKIAGSVRFEGAWPDSIDYAMVVASRKNPLVQSVTVLDLDIGTIIPSGTNYLEYAINVSPALYQTVSVLLVPKERALTFDDFYYANNIGAVSINPIEVAENETVQGPQFYVTLNEVKSRIQGTVTFTGQWPAEAAEVRMIAANTFPPQFEEVIIGEIIPPDANTYAYDFKLPQDTYNLIGVAWRAEGTTWDLLSVCGFYLEDGDSLAPAEVTIPTETSIVTNIRFGVDRSKARVTSETRIVGSVTFSGNWPEDIIEARVIATTKFNILPIQLPTLLDLGFSDPIAPGTTSLNYEIMAFPGKFKATAIIFFREGQQLDVNGILYSSQVGGLNLDSYEVQMDEQKHGPDFTIQF